MNLLRLFGHETEITTYDDDAVVFREGDVGEAMYVVVEGEVILSVRGHDIERLAPGELFGEMALIDAEARSATATAKNGCKLARIDEHRFTFMVQQTPFFALEVMRILARRLRHMDNTIA